MFKSVFDRLGAGFRKHRAQIDAALSPVEPTIAYARVDLDRMDALKPGQYMWKEGIGGHGTLKAIFACGEGVTKEAIITLGDRPFRVLGVRYFSTTAIFEALVLPSPDRATVIHNDRPMAD